MVLAQSREVGGEVGLFGGPSRFLVRLEKPLLAVFVTPIGGGGDRVLAGPELFETLMRTGRA